MTATVVSVQVGKPVTSRWLGREVVTAFYKTPVAGRVRARGVNLQGDEQGDRGNHGGRNQAIYAYAQEDADRWGRELGRRLGPGAFGENLTLRGLDLTGLRVGSRLGVGSSVLRVTGPRIPCLKLGMAMGDRRFPVRFGQVDRPGAYLAIDVEGEIGAGDDVEVVSTPHHDVTVGLIHAAYHRDRSLWSRVLAVDDLPDGWSVIAAERQRA